jgi:hypothetical protein
MLGAEMHATMRRYEGIVEGSKDELTRKVGESLMPSLSKLEGFNGYYLIESGDGVFTSVGLFDTATQSEESTRVASTWLIDQKLESILPNPPKVTSGEVIAHQLTNGAISA